MHSTIAYKISVRHTRAGSDPIRWTELAGSPYVYFDARTCTYESRFQVL
jgi:hypothetical protein